MLKEKRNVLSVFWVGVLSIAFLANPFFSKDAEALSQWSRKYQVPCGTCHTSFPRLNYFGEQFLRNGFQWPGGEKPDGDTTGKEALSDTLFLDQVGNWLGGRISLTAMKYKSNALTVNGVLEDSFNLGNPNWLQLFVGGTLFKDVAIFIEQEFEVDGSKFSWFHLFFTNLGGSSLANIQVGKLSPADFTPFSDRLRIWQKSDVLNIKSSGGAGENSINIRASRPGIQFYGYRGPLLWFAGVDNGKDASDADRDKNVWGGLRLEVTDTMKSDFEGSSASFHIYSGKDSASTSTARVENDFMRYTFAANVRYGENYDFQFTYQIGEDDNYTLTTPAVNADFTGFTGVGAYWKDPYYFVIQYDQIDSNDLPGIEVKKVSPSIWYFLRDNFKVGIASRIDVSNATSKTHEVSAEIRSMF